MSRYLTHRALCHPALPISRKESRQGLQHVDLNDQLEFYSHLGAESDARVEPGINQDEVFDDQFERRAHEIQRTPSSVNAVNVISAKTGPWTGNNNLGIERSFAPDSNNRQTILKLPEWGFPEMWTLCLGLIFDPNQWNPAPGLTPAFDVTAVIEFGGGGCIQTVECDWINGCAISLPMNAVNVIAQYNFDDVNEGTDPSQPPLDLRLRANIVRNQFGTPIAPIRTFKNEILTGLTINLPPFARRMKVVPSRTLEASIVPFYQQSGVILFQSGVDGNNGLAVQMNLFSQLVETMSVADGTIGPPAWIDVPTGARSVRFAPGGATMQALIIFEVGV